MKSDRKRFRPGGWPLLTLVALTPVALTLVACSSSAEREAVCDRAVGLQNELSAVSRTLDDIAIASPQQLANTFAVTLSTLTTLSDLGPSSLRDDFGLLLAVYESLAASIEATGWNGDVAVSDSVVIKARTKLVSNEVVEAREAVRLYAVNNCSAELGSDIEKFQGIPTTLPNPVVPDPNAPEPTTGFDNDDTIASSYGYYVAEQYNLAITNEQAICIGTALTEQAILDLQKADDAYAQLISATLVACGVNADIPGS